MSGRNFSLTPHLSAFIDEQVASGRHQNASEVIREALRRYEEDVAFTTAQIEEIKTIAIQGRGDLERGEYFTVNTAEDAQALRQALRAEARELVGQRANRDGTEVVNEVVTVKL